MAIRFLDVYDRKPFVVLAALAAWGATGAAVIALAGNEAVQGMLDDQTRRVLGDAISAPVVEELAKGIALVAAAAASIWASRRIDVAPFEGLTAGIVYGAAVGLGFSFTEDFFYFVNEVGQSGLKAGEDLFVDRRDFLGPGVLRHPIFTAAFGACLGLATVARGRAARFALPIAGLALAILLHALNNGLTEFVLTRRYGLEAADQWLGGSQVSAEVDSTGRFYDDVMAVLDYVYIAAFALAGALWVRHQRRIVRDELAEEVESGLIERDAREAAYGYRRRIAQYWGLLLRGRLDRWRRMTRLNDELSRMALLKRRIRMSGGDWGRVERARRRIVSLQTVEHVGASLPSPATELIGRDPQAAAVVELLREREVRLVTLTGPGGTGKTRLALRVAAELTPAFPSGAYFVALTPLADPERLVPEIARHLGVPDAGGDPLQQRLESYLADKQLLLVLDNFEQLLGAAPRVAELLRAAPRMKVLATSRVPLKLSGERAYPVPPLTLPPAEASDAAAVLRSEAGALFAARAAAVRNDFEVVDENAAAVAQICARVDGLPLAIELAASRCNVLRPDEIEARLDGRLQLLTTGSGDLPQHQRTLRATLDWSHDLLAEDQQTLFRQLAVFAGGCDAEAAEAVCGRTGGPVLDGLSALADSSLLVVDQQPSGVRFAMLETVREYATERLEEDDPEELRRRHAHHYLELAERTEQRLEGHGQTAAFQRLEREHDNLRAAFDFLMRVADSERAGRLAATLTRFRERGRVGEGRAILEAAAAAEAGLSKPTRARVLHGAGRLALLQGDYERAAERLDRALGLYRALEDRGGMVGAVWQLGWVALVRGDYGGAESLFDESLELARAAGAPEQVARAQAGIGRARLERRDLPGARGPLAEALAARRDAGDERGVASSLAAIGRLELVSGNHAEARRVLGEGLTLARGLEDDLRIAEVLYPYGLLALEQGDGTEARRVFGERLRLCLDLGDRLGIAESLEAHAALDAAAGDAERAARLLGAAAGLREAIGVAPWAIEEERHRRHAESIRSHLGEDGFEEALEAGHRLDARAAAAVALDDADRAPVSRATTA